VSVTDGIATKSGERSDALSDVQWVQPEPSPTA
jgi:hypothetical protein